MSEPHLTRRAFVAGALAGPLLAGQRVESAAGGPGHGTRHQLYWGDLHNHNAVGYARGTLERSIEIAQEHLDFFAFTGHAAWHDMPAMPSGREKKWLDGFRVHREHWPKTRRLLREANSDRFVALLGYEWHSSRFGDYCLIFPEDQPDLFLPDHVEKLLDFAEARGALAVPHHVAYARGWRGANFDHFRPSTSPVVEILSEHGLSERTPAPLPYVRHSMGGRSTANTIQRQLEQGLRFGFVASSDSHRGYPGAYGEGITGVWAEDLSAAALFGALRARRAYAATGDRIALEVFLNGQPMGSELPWSCDRRIDIRVHGQDAVQMVELIRNGRTIHRYSPEDGAPDAARLPGRAVCRVQYGWGPWAALQLGRTCRWDMTIRVREGRFLAAVPCFQSGPYEEDLRDRLRIVSSQEIRLQSHTSRVKCFAEDPTKAVVCHLEGGPETVLEVALAAPVRQSVAARLSDLAHDNVITFTGGFTRESFILHRLVGPQRFSATIGVEDRRSGPPASDWYYVRVTQQNGQMAWSSPIWVG